MNILTLQMSDDKHNRLKSMAQAQGLNLNHLMDNLVNVALAEYDAKNHFQMRASRGNPTRGIQLLDKALKSN